MNKIATAVFLVIVFSIIEFLLFNLAGPWFVPNLILILIVFFTFQFGIRYSLTAAVIGGVIKDAFSIKVFGFYILGYVLSAFAAVFIRKYLFHMTSKELRFLMVFLLVIINFLFLTVIQPRFEPPDFLRALQFVFLPQLFSTLIVSEYTLTQIKKCVLRFCL